MSGQMGRRRDDVSCFAVGTAANAWGGGIRHR